MVCRALSYPLRPLNSKNTKFGEVSSKSLLKRKKEVMYYVELIPQLEMATKATFCKTFNNVELLQH